nr:putative sterigmatocystin biosynthesis peroxidase stcc [Quercus suber]
MDTSSWGYQRKYEDRLVCTPSKLSMRGLCGIQSFSSSRRRCADLQKIPSMSSLQQSASPSIHNAARRVKCHTSPIMRTLRHAQSGSGASPATPILVRSFVKCGPRTNWGLRFCRTINATSTLAHRPSNQKEAKIANRPLIHCVSLVVDSTGKDDGFQTQPADLALLSRGANPGPAVMVLIMAGRFLLALASVPAASALNLLDPGAILNLLTGLEPAPEGDPRYTNWVAPGPNDGLNTLANHGFIHHDGRNMTIPHLLEGLAAGMNIGADFTTVIGAVGLLSSPNPLGGSFDLNDLDEHNFPIEHDASLSRQDAYFGNDYSFYDPNWKQVLSHFAGSNYTSIQTASDAKWARVNDSLSRNPEVVYGAREFILSYGETSLYLQSMGSAESGVTNVRYIRSMFEQEKLPYSLGWRPSKDAITLETLGTMILELDAVNPAALPEGVTVLADSYKDLFEVLVGGSNALNNLTQETHVPADSYDFGMWYGWIAIASNGYIKGQDLHTDAITLRRQL